LFAAVRQLNRFLTFGEKTGLFAILRPNLVAAMAALEQG